MEGFAVACQLASAVPHLVSGSYPSLPSDAPSRGHPCASLVLRLHGHPDRRLSFAGRHGPARGREPRPARRHFPGDAPPVFPLRASPAQPRMPVMPVLVAGLGIPLGRPPVAARRTRLARVAVCLPQAVRIEQGREGRQHPRGVTGSAFSRLFRSKLLEPDTHFWLVEGPWTPWRCGLACSPGSPARHVVISLGQPQQTPPPTDWPHGSDF